MNAYKYDWCEPNLTKKLWLKYSHDTTQWKGTYNDSGSNEGFAWNKLTCTSTSNHNWHPVGLGRGVSSFE